MAPHAQAESLEARDRRENDERLAARAAEKLAALGAASRLTDPAALERKRAVVEAALARARRAAPTGKQE